MLGHEYDFIVVGAGPAGASLASRLAQSDPSLKVLLIEAGGKNDSPDSRYLFDRFATVATSPEYLRPYTTAAQTALNGQQIFYGRGKGLGGSSANNFCCYTIGPRDDYDEWARLVGDETFSWENAKRRYTELEAFKRAANESIRKYADPSSWHGTSGPVHIEFTERWENYMPGLLDAAVESGLPLNLDINSGNPIGVGVCPSTSHRGVRFTAATGFLEPPPQNLTVKTDFPVAKVLFDGKRAIGIQGVNGEQYKSSKEIILSGGSIDTPKLLLLSGVGPESELAQHAIPMVHELAGVGKNLRDHPHFLIGVEQKAGTDEFSQLHANPTTVEDARTAFSADQTGPFSYLMNSMVIGFEKDEYLLEIPEFGTLPQQAQDHLKLPTVPTWEFLGGFPAFFLLPALDPTVSCNSMCAMLMSPQSVGSVTLASSNPLDPPTSDPNFLSHPFDRISMIRAVRKVFGMINDTSMARHVVKVLATPASDSDEDILALLLEKGVSSTAHMSGTCKMGQRGDINAVVDTNFKVRGLEALRVVDMSVVPFVPSCHTVSWAYLIGWTAAEKIIAEYQTA